MTDDVIKYVGGKRTYYTCYVSNLLLECSDFSLNTTLNSVVVLIGSLETSFSQRSHRLLFMHSPSATVPLTEVNFYCDSRDAFHYNRET